MTAHETLFRSDIIASLLGKNITHPDWTIIEDKRSGLDIGSFIIFKKDDLFIKILIEENENNPNEKTLGTALERADSLSDLDLNALFKYSCLHNAFDISINTPSNLSNEDIIKNTEPKHYTHNDSPPFLLLPESHIFKDFFQSSIDLDTIFSTFEDNIPRKYHSFLQEAPFTLDYIHDKLIEHKIDRQNKIFYNDGDNSIYSIEHQGQQYFLVKSQSGGYLIKKTGEGTYTGFYFGDDSIYSTEYDILNSQREYKPMSFKVEDHKLTQYDSILGYFSYTMAAAVLQLFKLEPRLHTAEAPKIDIYDYYSIVESYQELKCILHEKKLLLATVEESDRIKRGIKI